MQQVWPELTLRQNKQLRAQCLQKRSNCEWQIERQVEDVALSEAFARKLLTRVGSSGNNNSPATKLRFQFFDYARNRQHLTNGDRVDPDGELGGVTQ